MFRHNITFQTLQHHRFIRRYPNHTIPAFYQTHPFPHNGIPVRIFPRQLMQRPPGTQIRPTEISRENINIMRMLHHGIINGYILTFGKTPIHHLLLSRSIKTLLQLIKNTRNLRLFLPESLFYRRHIPDKNTGIPQIPACPQILLRRLPVGGPSFTFIYP